MAIQGVKGNKVVPERRKGSTKRDSTKKNINGKP